MPLKTIPIVIALTSPAGVPLVGVTVSATLIKSATLADAFDIDAGVVVPQAVSANTDSAGSATLNLWPNARGSQSTLYRIRAQFGAAVLLSTYIVVPDSTAGVPVDLGTLISSAVPAALIDYTVPPRLDGGVDLIGLQDLDTGLDWSSPGTLDLVVNGSVVGRLTPTGLQLLAGLSYTGTLTGGTGVVNLGSGQLVKDAAGNVGIGVVPSAIWSAAKAIQVSTGFTLMADSVNAYLTSNSFYNGTNFIYTSTQSAYRYDLTTSGHKWYTAPVGTAGDPISFTQAMTLDSSGNLGIGTSSPNWEITAYGSLGANVAAQDSTGAMIMTVAYGIGYLTNTTANPIVFRTNTTERMRLDASGNLGLGVTPSAWGTSYKALQTPTGSLAAYSPAGQIWLGQNVYDSGVGSYTYVSTSQATRFQQDSGVFRWLNAPSGTAGNAITFTQAMTLDANGRLGIVTTTPQANLAIGVGSTASANPTYGANILIAPNMNTLNMAGGIEFRASDFSSGYGFRISSPDLGSGNTPLVFERRTASATWVESLRLDSTGNLGIGTASPNASAILDAQSTTKGVRMPNMTTTQKNSIASPAAGLMVFDTTLAKLCVYTGAAWQTITSV